MHVVLEGCVAQPLGSYLKALAVLRLVAEQVDREARGWWAAGCFHLESELDMERLTHFFLEAYQPTPLIAPWNGGSGFYPKDRKIGIEGILSDTGGRFAEFRKAITVAQSLPEVLAATRQKSKSEEDERRTAILRQCRNWLPNKCVDWLDAVIVLASDGKRAFAPILGTGGNEGRLDYTNNFMEYLRNLLIAKDPVMPVTTLLRNALFAEPTGGMQPSSVGQFDPGRAGGFNQGQAVETKDFPSNPWNFVLTLEGAVLWAGGVYRKQGISYSSFLCSPFTVMPSPVGYGSASENDRTLSKAEIWVPLWQAPVSYRELRALLREGRAAIGTKPARTGLEFAEAACALGVDRGISGFVRYSLLKRRGDSFVALPTGEFRAEYRSESDLIRQMMPLLEDVEHALKKSAAYESHRRQFDATVYEALLRGETQYLRDAAAAFGRIVRWLLLNGKGLHTREKLAIDWAKKLSEFPEARIAAGLASICGGSIRDNLDAERKDFAWRGRDLSGRLTSVIERRLLRSEKFWAVKTTPLGDVSHFLLGDVDDELIEDLIFAFLPIAWDEDETASRESCDDIPPIYVLLRMPFLNLEAPDGQRLVPDQAVFAQLEAGDASLAAALAARKLRMRGYNVIDVEFGSGDIDATRLAASLALPAWLPKSTRALVLHEDEDTKEVE